MLRTPQLELLEEVVGARKQAAGPRPQLDPGFPSLSSPESETAPSWDRSPLPVPKPRLLRTPRLHSKSHPKFKPKSNPDPDPRPQKPPSEWRRTQNWRSFGRNWFTSGSSGTSYLYICMENVQHHIRFEFYERWIGSGMPPTEKRRPLMWRKSSCSCLRS